MQGSGGRPQQPAPRLLPPCCQQIPPRPPGRPPAFTGRALAAGHDAPTVGWGHSARSAATDLAAPDHGPRNSSQARPYPGCPLPVLISGPATRTTEPDRMTDLNSSPSLSSPPLPASGISADEFLQALSQMDAA